MNDNSDDGTVIKIILVGGAGYLIYQVVNVIVAALTALFFGLVTIALIGAGIFAAYWLFRYITDQQYGQQKQMRQIEKIERERRETIARLPKHLREHADQYFKDKQQSIYESKTQSRADEFFARIRKWRKGDEQ